MNVFSPRDLPEGSQPWAREVEARLTTIQSRIGSLHDSVKNQLRVTGGQLSVASEQVDELYLRTPQRVSIPNISVTAPPSGLSSPEGTHTFSFPPPNLPRPARIEVYGLYENLTNTAEFSFLRFGSDIVSKDRASGLQSFPDANLVTYVTVPAQVSPTFTLSYQVIAFSGSPTCTMTGISAYLTWGAPLV